MINQIEKRILVNFFVDILHRLIYHHLPARFSELDAGNVVLLQIKVFGRNIKETGLTRYFMKVTVRPSFTQLRAIRQINRVH